MIFLMALRNIIRNKKNNIIVLFLIAVIIFLFFIGNSIIGIAQNNIRLAFIESLTGDVVLQKSGDITMNMFSANAPIIDAFFSMPVLPDYSAVMDIVSAEKGVGGITSQISGRAFLDVLGIRETALLCGINAESYFDLFPGIVLEEGRFLTDGELGAMITLERAKSIEAQSGQTLQVGMSLLFTSGGADGFKIREIPLVGIFSYQNPGQFMNEIILIDPKTVRDLNSVQTVNIIDLDNISLDLLRADIDDIFNGFSSSADNFSEGEFSINELQDYLSETREEIDGIEFSGDWNFIIMRLDKKNTANSFISSLNKKIEPYGVTAVNWRIAAGNSAILILLVQALFNSGLFIVSIAGVFAVINIHLISIFRRVREIGTLRAIGASNNYIRSLIYNETVFISAFAGFIGVLGGVIFIRYLNSMNIHIANELVVSLMSGDIIQLLFFPNLAIVSLGIAILLGLASAAYPVEKAVGLEPITAVRQG